MATRSASRPLEEAANLLSNRVAGYQYKQQQEREAEERRQREIADRREQEKQTKLREQAAAATKTGNGHKAAELRQQARDTYVAPKPVAPVVKTDTSIRITYDVEVLNARHVPDQYKIVDVARIKRVKLADPTIEVPGIRFIKRAIGSTRRE